MHLLAGKIRSGAYAPVALTYRSNASVANNPGAEILTPTFSSMSIGGQFVGRKLIACFNYGINADENTKFHFLSATADTGAGAVAGTRLTNVGTDDIDGPAGTQAIFIWDTDEVSTATTATVIPTLQSGFSGSGYHFVGCVLYTMQNGGVTADDSKLVKSTGEGEPNNYSWAVTAPAGSAILAVTGKSPFAALTLSGTGIAQDIKTSPSAWPAGYACFHGNYAAETNVTLVINTFHESYSITQGMLFKAK